MSVYGIDVGVGVDIIFGDDGGDKLSSKAPRVLGAGAQRQAARLAAKAEANAAFYADTPKGLRLAQPTTPKEPRA